MSVHDWPVNQVILGTAAPLTRRLLTRLCDVFLWSKWQCLMLFTREHHFLFFLLLEERRISAMIQCQLCMSFTTRPPRLFKMQLPLTISLEQILYYIQQYTLEYTFNYPAPSSVLLRLPTASSSSTCILSPFDVIIP